MVVAIGDLGVARKAARIAVVAVVTARVYGCVAVAIGVGLSGSGEGRARRRKNAATIVSARRTIKTPELKVTS